MFTGENIPVDLNNPKNIWSINKFCENKSEYLEYHSKVAAAFKQDCENLLLVFAAREDFTFKVFADVWQQLSFSLVFVGQEFFDELPIFAEACFFIIKKYLLFSTNVYIQVGAFYLLYGIYGKQLSKEVLPIRMTMEEYSTLLKLVEHMYRNRNTEDFAYIFRYLKHSQAFQFVATTRCSGLESKFTWQERNMKNDIFRHVVDKNPVTMLEKVLYSDDTYNLFNLDKICGEYDEALKEYAVSTSSKPLTIHKESHVVKKVENLFHHLKEELEDQPQTVNENAIVAQKKKSIREKAFRIVKQQEQHDNKE